MPKTMIMHTPPQNQGQIVEVSYGMDGEAGWAYRRTVDRSGPTTTWERVAIEDICDCDRLCDCWDPANTEPEVCGAWEECEAPKL